MKIILLNIAILSLLALDSFSQNQFINHYGDFTGYGRSLIINSNGNYVIAGESLDGPTLYIIDEFGEVLLTKTFNTISGVRANQIIQTDDGGYLLVGSSYETGNMHRKLLMIKTTNIGEILWSKQFGNSEIVSASAVHQLSSGDYVVAGSKLDENGDNFDFYLLKLSSEGELIWDNTYGGDNNDRALSMEQTNDGGYILSGYSETFTNGGRDYFLVKTNINGEQVWSKHFGGALKDECKKVRQTSDLGYIMTGFSKSSDMAIENMYVIKTNDTGEVIWEKRYGHEDQFSIGSDIIQTDEGGYAITGQIITSSSNGFSDLYLVKIDKSGNVEWEKEFKVEPDNIFYTNSSGLSIQQTTDGGFAIAGTWFNASTNEILLVKTNIDGIVKVENELIQMETKIFPNPFNTYTNLFLNNPDKEVYDISILDLNGNLIRTIPKMSSDQVRIERRNLLKGIYVLRLKSVSKTESRLIVVE